jgi:hypothetical protein
VCRFSEADDPVCQGRGVTGVAWPDDLLRARAATIGPALQQLIDHEPRWIHRRIERIELTSTTQLVRRVEANLTVPPGLARDLRYNAGEAGRFVVPFGVLPKAPLVDFALEPKEVQRLTADQANPLVVAALTPLAERTGALLADVLRLLRVIVRNEQPGGATGSPEYRSLAHLLGEPRGNSPARELLERARELDSNYVLLGVLTTPAGIPTRVSYSYRQEMLATTGGVDDPPLAIDVDLPNASGPGPAFRVELAAPEGLDIEAANMVARTRSGARVLVRAGKGDRFVQLRAPDAQDRPAAVGLQVAFGFPPDGIHALATIAGATSTAALGLAVGASYVPGDILQGGSASAFLAAPALVTGLVLGFATTPITSRPVNRLRAAAFVIALLGVLGGLTVALLGGNKEYVDLLHWILIGLTCASLLVWGAFPLRAWLRVHERRDPPPGVPE